MALGATVAGPVVDRALRPASILFPAILAAGMVGVVLTGGHFAGLFVAVALWGFGYGGATPAAQTWAAKAAPDHLEQVGGLAVVTFQSGIALGAIVGGLLVDGIAPTAPLVVGAIVAVIGGILLTSLRLRPATS